MMMTTIFIDSSNDVTNVVILGENLVLGLKSVLGSTHIVSDWIPDEPAVVTENDQLVNDDGNEDDVKQMALYEVRWN